MSVSLVPSFFLCSHFSGVKIKAKASKKQESDLKIALPATSKGKNLSGTFKVEGLSLDATAVDIWKGTNAAILMMDPVKKWTYEYAVATIEKVPEGIDLLLVANFRDTFQYWNVSMEEIRKVSQSRKDTFVTDASMLNGFGMKSILNFLNIPFLKIKTKHLKEQLERTEQDLKAAEEELILVSQNQKYDKQESTSFFVVQN